MDGLIDTIERMLQPWKNRLMLLTGKIVYVMVDDSGDIQRVQATGLFGELHNNMPRLGLYGFHSVPPADTVGQALFAGGERDSGVTVADVHQPSKPKGWLPGESGIHNENAEAWIRITDDNDIVLHGRRIIQEASEDIRIYAGKTYRVDVQGYATQLQHEGGVTWRNVSWTIDAVFAASIDNAIEPPRVSAP